MSRELSRTLVLNVGVLEHVMQHGIGTPVPPRFPSVIFIDRRASSVLLLCHSLYLFAGNATMNILTNISATFWSPEVWLPPNITWKDISPNADNKYANYQHLVYPLPMALVLLGIRYALER